MGWPFSQENTMALIKYVGKKASREDTVAGTKIVWVGAGDVREVPDLAANKLLSYPDVWAIAARETKKVASPVVSAPVADQIPVEPGHDQVATPEGDKGPRYVMRTDSGELLLDDLDKATLRELAKEAGLKIHHAKSEDFFRESLAAAFPVKAD